ncbi:MAG: hypothetical protein D6726_04280 [Nitrospirae bacterium]|nr:MAG: hypothetical protein D6726_04280 [Nitrospirota bacterium]
MKLKENKKLLAGILIILVLSVAVLYQYGYGTYKGRLETIQEERAILEKTITKYQRVIEESKGLKEELNALRTALKDEELKLLSGETPALASASLQSMVKEIISSEGATIRSERVEKTEEKDGFRIVSVSIDLSVPSITELSNIIYNIESRTPYMVIKEMNIRVRNYRRPGVLTVRLKISGISRAR